MNIAVTTSTVADVDSKAELGLPESPINTLDTSSFLPAHAMATGRLKPLRICLLGYRSAPFGGGQGIYIKYLSKALLAMGHQVEVISGEPYPQLEPGIKLIKMPGLNLYEKGLSSIRPRHLLSYTNMVEWFSKLTGGFAEPYCFGRRVDAYLRHHGHSYDLIHDNQSLSYGMLNIQQRLPTVTTLHHPITRDFGLALNATTKLWQRLFLRRWYTFLNMQAKVVRRLDNVVTVSKRSRRDIAQAFDVGESSIEMIYNGIDTEEFKPRDDIQRNPFRLMATASADQPLKGLRYLLLAYAELLKEYPKLELLVVGKPQVGGDTESLLESLKIADQVRFVSGISTAELVNYYAEASIAVVPSVYEGFGLPVGEAMACEVPVVSSCGGALPEVVGDAGIVVPTENEQAIAKAVKTLLDNPEKRQALGEAGRRRILTKFSWEVAAVSMTNYYSKVIEDYANS